MAGKFYKILESEPRYLSSAANQEIPTLGKMLVTIYTQLSHEALEARMRLWKLTPKFHLFQHLCQHQIAMWGATHGCIGHILTRTSKKL